MLVRPENAPLASAAPCVVYSVTPMAAVTTDDAFDALLEEMESDPASAEHLRAGRRWVAQAFYDDEPTLASLRLAAGLSQKQLGMAAGLEQSHISRYESGKHAPGLDTADALAAALGVDLNTFGKAWQNSRARSESKENTNE